MPKPDFTGTWTFNREKSRLQIPAPDATVFVVDHREPALRISRTHFAGDSRDTFSLDLTTEVAEERFRSESLNYDNLWTLDKVEVG